MNIFFVIDDELVTPRLNGSILPGITRDTVLKLAERLGYQASERDVSIDELVAAGEAGRLREVFGSGTAAVIAPVGEIGYGGHSIHIGDGNPGPITRQLFRTITDIQYGQTEAPAGWIEPVL